MKYEISRAKLGQHRLYMEAKKLANARRDRLKKNRLTSAEIEEIKKTAREPTKLEKQNPKNIRVRMENMTPEQIKDTVKKVRQDDQNNTLNIINETKKPHRENENVTTKQILEFDAGTN